jgi:hypothetical protein
MQDTEIEAVAHTAFPGVRHISIFPASNAGGMQFHDADSTLQNAGIAAVSWEPTTGVLYFRRLPSNYSPLPEQGGAPRSTFVGTETTKAEPPNKQGSRVAVVILVPPSTELDQRTSSPHQQAFMDRPHRKPSEQ